MRWRWYRRFLIILVIIATLGGSALYINIVDEDNQQVSKGSLENIHLTPGGMPIGIYMEIDGILVLDTERLEDLDGNMCEPAKNVIKKGDYIVSINEMKVDDKQDLIKAVNDMDQKDVILGIRREEACFEVSFDAVEVEDGEYKLGVWVRDNVQGLGTITYVTDDNQFGALGHGIHDIDTDELLSIKGGNIYGINVVGIQKGKRGEPGGMEGVILYNHRNILGTISSNTENGVYGTVQKRGKIVENDESLQICQKKDIKLGDATIRSAITGEVKEYDIKIISVDYFARNENKRIMIEVVDEELLELTGGIVQGMSGSPLIQNGKLIGAVTHVLVNDPTRGYGIFIENMLETANQVAEEQKDAS